MSDMMKMFVEQELQNQIKENYPHMQYPPGLYAKVVSVEVLLMQITGANDVDIMLDEDGQPVSDGNGDTALVSDDECWLQDIKNEAMTEEGELFYEDEEGDASYGWSLLDFMQGEYDDFTQMEIQQRIRSKMSKRDYIDAGSIQTTVNFDGHIYHIRIAFRRTDSNSEWRGGDCGMIDESIMEKIIPLPDEDEEMEKVQGELEGEGFPITNFKKGGIFYHLCRMLVTIYIELKELARTIVNGCFIKHAEGDWLKIKAADYSKQQKEAKAARGYVSIYRSEYNNALQVTKGHCFKTEPDAGGNELKFYCCENTVIDAGEPVGRVLVEAEATGTYYNIAPGRITISMIHLDGVDYVTNEDDWLFEEGAEEEDLEDLRDRCMSSWAELATRTIEEKLRNAAKAVPGVLDARIDAQHPRGQGTVDVIVTGAAGEASPELIRKVGEAIEPLKGNYEDYLVKSSEVVRHLAEDAATDGVDAQATKLIEDMMALTRGEMNTLYRDSIIQVLSTKIDNYRKTDILQPSDDMVLEQDKVIMAGDINVTVRNVVQSARGKE